MTNSNENELKVADVLSGLDMIDTTFHKTRHELAIKNAINLIKQQAEQLEAAQKEIKETITSLRYLRDVIWGFDEKSEPRSELINSAIETANFVLNKFQNQVSTKPVEG